MREEEKKELSELLQKEIDQERMAGIVLGVYERGEQTYYGAWGMADRENGTVMDAGTICRLYSMSKPVAAVGAMILWERGLLDLDAAVSEYLPEYGQMQVLQGGALIPARRRILIRDLLNMTAGIVYPDEDEAGKKMETLFARIHDRINKGNGYSTRDIVREIAKMPLASQPGERWRYGLCADVLGAVMEAVTGKKLGTFYEEEIFAPLGMEDTGFFIGKDKAGRFAQLYKQVPGPHGGVHLEIDEERHLGLTLCLEPPAFESAGAGLLSTLKDSSRFCRMLAGKGEYKGVRILKESTVRGFTQNQLTPEQLKTINFEHLPGYGFGSFMRVLQDPATARTKGNIGEFGWDGWCGPYMAVDIEKEKTVVFMVQVSAYSNWELTREMRRLL